MAGFARRMASAATLPPPGGGARQVTEPRPLDREARLARFCDAITRARGWR